MKKCTVWLLLLFFYYTCAPDAPFIVYPFSEGPHRLRKPDGCFHEAYGHMKKGTTLTIPGNNSVLKKENIKLPGQCVMAECFPDGSMDLLGCMLPPVLPDYCDTGLKPYPKCCEYLCLERGKEEENEKRVEKFYYKYLEFYENYGTKKIK